MHRDMFVKAKFIVNIATKLNVETIQVLDKKAENI